MKKEIVFAKSKLPKYKVGIDKNGKKYRYHGDVLKPDFPIKSRVQLKNSAKTYYELLKSHFPIMDMDHPKPLQINVQMALKERIISSGIMPYRSEVIHLIVRNYTNSLAYKKALILNKYRYDIEGNVTEKEIRAECKVDALNAIKFYLQEQTAQKELLNSKKSKLNKGLSTKPVYKVVNKVKKYSPVRAS